MNFSCGYYNAHKTCEYVLFEEMQNTLRVVEKLLRMECDQFEFIRKKYDYFHNGGYLYGKYDDWYTSYYCGASSDSSKGMTGLEILYNKYMLKDGTYYPTEENEWILGEPISECFGDFFMQNPDVCFHDVLDYYPM